jgi:prepilin peptidase CpaA
VDHHSIKETAVTISTGAYLAASFCFATVTVWAGVMDLITMKIRNEIVLFLLAVYAAIAPLAGLDAVQIGWSAAVAFGVLTGMFVFFGFGWIGGGDAKLAAIIALWLGPEHTLSYLLYTAIFGGVLTLGLLQFRSMPLPVYCVRIPWLTQLHEPRNGVPYGVAIATAALFVFPSTIWVTALS